MLTNWGERERERREGKREREIENLNRLITTF